MCDQEHRYNYHEYIGGPQDFEYARITDGGSLVVRVAKAGGGEIGQRYTGAWYYSVHRNGTEVMHGDDLECGTPKTHADMAAVVTDLQAAGAFKVIQTDTLTGWKRYLDNMSTSPWTDTFTREEAEATVKWQHEHITRRYACTIVPVEPYMTGNDAARTRHQDRHSSHRRMEDCINVDCREAAMRLLNEDLDRRLAKARKDK